MVKLKTKTQTKGKGKSPKKGLPSFVWLVIALGIVAIIAVVRMSTACEPSGSSQPEELKSAIIDQLHTLQPNEAFIEQTTQYLEDYGFEVDLYQGDAVTVDLYRKLPTYGYKMIIFRVHSGLLGVDPKVTNKTWLFTAEPYSKTKHVTEQLTDQVTYAKTYNDAPWTFAISSKFIYESMERQFNNTAILMMGCDCLHFEDLAQAFIQRGASVYIAWDASVLLGYVDGATTVLVEKLCSKDLTVGKAIAQTMDEKGPDPDYGAVLKYFPRQSGNKTIRQLTE